MRGIHWQNMNRTGHDRVTGIVGSELRPWSDRIAEANGMVRFLVDVAVGNVADSALSRRLVSRWIPWTGVMP